MDILLMADVPDLGTEGSVVKVADGYARNYLIPKNLGAPVTAATQRRLAKIQREREQARVQDLARLRETAAALTRESVTVRVKAGHDDKLFGSVTNADIAAALKAGGFDIDRHKIAMEEPIKALGTYDVAIKLDPEVVASVKVWVVED